MKKLLSADEQQRRVAKLSAECFIYFAVCACEVVEPMLSGFFFFCLSACTCWSTESATLRI